VRSAQLTLLSATPTKGKLMSGASLKPWKRVVTKAGMTSSLLFLATAAHAGPPLKAGAPIQLEGTHGGFDFIEIDASANRLLLDQEKGNTAFDVFDLKTKKLVKRVPTGITQDVAVDLKRDRYYVSGNDPGRTLIISRATLKIIGEVPLPTPTNLIGYDAASGLIYETSDSTPQIFVIDPASKRVVTTINLQGSGMQGIEFDRNYKRLFQAIKATSTITSIDPATNKILLVWSIASCSLPHGTAIVPDGLLAACNGSLVLVSRATGEVIARADTAPDVDEIAYDPGNHLTYCASKDGEISIVRVTGDKLKALGSISDEKTTHSVAVDPKTHTVWIGYAKDNDSFVQPFTPTE
jgi:DNA-binding beta-propeller fold protein YncE